MLFNEETIEPIAWLYEIGTVIGIALLVISLLLIFKITRLFPGGSVVKKWRIMQVIIVAFIILYIIDWGVWFYDDHALIFFITGLLRIGTGSILVLVIYLFYKTINLVLVKSRQ